MNRFRIAVFLNLFISLAAVCRSEIHVVDVGRFDKIKVLDNIDVVFRWVPDSAGMVSYEDPRHPDELFLFSNKANGMLKIQSANENVLKLPVLHVYSDFLAGVENSSAGIVDIETMAPCTDFKATQIGNGMINIDDINAMKITASINTGNGSISLSGSCQSAVFKMVGTGVISADRLKADKVQCKILGTGSIGCWPLESLNVMGLGTTKIYYKGNPAIKKSGGGKLFELPSSESRIKKAIERRQDTVADEDELDDEDNPGEVTRISVEEEDPSDSIEEETPDDEEEENEEATIEEEEVTVVTSSEE